MLMKKHIAVFFSNQSNAVIITADIDCLIIWLTCRKKLCPSLKIWLEVSVQSRNNWRIISVDSKSSKLGKNFCKSLPAYQEFTGSDFTASFGRKGMFQPIKKLEKYVQAQIAFGHLGELDDDQRNDFTEIEKFTCKMYCKKNLKKIHDVRTKIFMKKCKPKIDGGKISYTKKLEPSMMLSWERVLLSKIRRTKFDAKIWIPSSEASPPNYSTLDRNYQLLWLADICHQAPLILHKNVKNMTVSTVCYCCCFFIGSFCWIFDMNSG